ncbi:hypothetical protein HPB47_026385 [Ixodes persulcatus]|uniref:Uncharacterized protein n=1 Tax=Ixodes persulcatus TaxID=34615 RepID=A0AC60PYY6_IXOPE|nr:hypothetical protein HPB47_026385 [Ixodes persulcatus]
MAIDSSLQTAKEKAAALFIGCMDRDSIEELGLEPLRNLFSLLGIHTLPITLANRKTLDVSGLAGQVMSTLNLDSFVAVTLLEDAELREPKVLTRIVPSWELHRQSKLGMPLPWPLGAHTVANFAPAEPRSTLLEFVAWRVLRAVAPLLPEPLLELGALLSDDGKPGAGFPPSLASTCYRVFKRTLGFAFGVAYMEDHFTKNTQSLLHKWARNSGLKADTERISVYTNCNESIDALQGHAHVGTTEHTMNESAANFSRTRTLRFGSAGYRATTALEAFTSGSVHRRSWTSWRRRPELSAGRGLGGLRSSQVLVDLPRSFTITGARVIRVEPAQPESLVSASAVGVVCFLAVEAQRASVGRSPHVGLPGYAGLHAGALDLVVVASVVLRRRRLTSGRRDIGASRRRWPSGHCGVS